MNKLVIIIWKGQDGETEDVQWWYEQSSEHTNPVLCHVAQFFFDGEVTRRSSIIEKDQAEELISYIQAQWNT